MATAKGIVSPDDHLIEPPHLWTSRLPQKMKERGPRVVRERGHVAIRDGNYDYTQDESGNPVDVWYFEDVRVPSTMTTAAAGRDNADVDLEVITYDDMRPGCYQQAARLEDMDVAGIEASLCFPNLFVRFCGQRFLFAEDKELALACVEAYNDYMIEEWCAGSDGRLIPLGIIPLWDIELAVREVERVADRGVHAICFSELPNHLGLPSIHSKYWDPLFAACEASNTAIMMHIGSSSRLPVTSPDAPPIVVSTLPAVNSAMSLVDWLFSGVLLRFPQLKIGMAECQAGWIPYFLQRADELWYEHRGWKSVQGLLPEAPSTYFPGRIYCTIFSDPFAIKNIDLIGKHSVMFESDYPHMDGSWPNCLEVGREATKDLDSATADLVLRGNARELLGLS